MKHLVLIASFNIVKDSGTGVIGLSYMVKGINSCQIAGAEMLNRIIFGCQMVLKAPPLYRGDCTSLT